MEYLQSGYQLKHFSCVHRFKTYILFLVHLFSFFLFFFFSVCFPFYFPVPKDDKMHTQLPPTPHIDIILIIPTGRVHNYRLIAASMANFAAGQDAVATDLLLSRRIITCSSILVGPAPTEIYLPFCQEPRGDTGSPGAGPIYRVHFTWHPLTSTNTNPSPCNVLPPSTTA